MTIPAADMKSKPERYFEQTREEMLPYVPRDAKTMLDIGCARGSFSALVKARGGVECWGIELEEEAAKVAETKLDKVIRGDVNQCLDEVPDGYFDCIVCNDILEHLVNPWTLLQRLKAKLTSNGAVIVCLPNIRYCRVLFDVVMRGNWDYKDSGILDKTHLRFFTFKSVAKTFSGLGYRLLKIEGVEPDPTLPARLVKLLCLLFFNVFVDIRFHHIVCVARPADQDGA